MTEIVVYKYSAHYFSPDFGSECLQRRKKSLSGFVLDSKTKEDDKIVLQSVGFEISRERQGLPLKPIETTAKSSFTSFLASEASFLRREAAKGSNKFAILTGFFRLFLAGLVLNLQ